MRSAFTMVEVLVTLAFASILLPTVMQGISLCLATAGQARQEAQGAALAHSKLTELTATAQYQAGIMSGDFGTDWPEFRWEAQLESWDGVALEQLEITVSWKQAGKDRSVSVATLVYVPTGNGSAYVGSGVTASGTPTGGTP
jgi:type II secretory pathway pseudopilin PulG